MQTKVLEMCVLRPSNSTAEGFSQVNRYIGGAIRGFLCVCLFSAVLLITMKIWKQMFNNTELIIK